MGGLSESGKDGGRGAKAGGAKAERGAEAGRV